jgi:Na+-translocating ferredoxin:NAD+ oxidoreductase RnfD subunit
MAAAPTRLTRPAARDRGRLHAARRFARTPKGYLLAVFLCLMAAAWITGLLPHTAAAATRVTAAVGTAVVVDLALAIWRRGAWEFPSGALLTGLIVALVLSPHEPWYVAALPAAIGIVARYTIRSRSANVFNPAALGLAVSGLLIGGGESWWGALPDEGLVGIGGLVVLLVGGVFIAARINKLPLVLTFLGTYFVLFAVASFLGDPGRVAEVFRTPDLNAVIFFACFMLDDPPTCPVRYFDQIVFAVLVGAAAFAAFVLAGVVYYLSAALLLGNLWEAWRRRSEAPASAREREAAA